LGLLAFLFAGAPPGGDVIVNNRQTQVRDIANESLETLVILDPFSYLIDEINGDINRISTTCIAGGMRKAPKRGH